MTQDYPDYPDFMDTPEYEAYHVELEALEAVAIARRGKEPPKAWGDKLSETHYFCTPCWQRGYDEGHPHSMPPCDPLPRPDW